MPEDRSVEVNPLVRLGRTLEGAVPPVALAALGEAARQAQREAELFALRMAALRAAWWNLPPEAKWQEDPHRYRAEVLDEACPAYGYLRLPVALGLWGEG